MFQKMLWKSREKFSSGAVLQKKVAIEIRFQKPLIVIKSRTESEDWKFFEKYVRII